MTTPPPVTSGFADRPDYRVDILRRRNEVTARLGATVIARSTRTLLVDEQDHGLVFYFPFDDVLVELTAADGVTTRCPYKGDALYWLADGADAPVAWSYYEPYEQVSAIADHVAFDQRMVEVVVGPATPAVLGHPSLGGHTADDREG